jgi:hypothetical protein
MEDLVRVGVKLWDFSKDPPGNPEQAIAKALEMKLSGPGSVFSRFEDDDELVLAARMHWHIQGQQNETNAKYIVAQEQKAEGRSVSESTVLRAWQKHRHLFEKLLGGARGQGLPRRRQGRRCALGGLLTPSPWTPAPGRASCAGSAGPTST